MYKEKTKDKILYTAIILFSKYGYDQVPLKEIAFEAGVTTDILRHHFSNKEQLMNGIFDYIYTNLEHYGPTEGELEEQFKVLTPKEILMKFVTNYHFSNDYLMMHIYRIMFMVRYKDETLMNLVNDYLLKQPIGNLKRAIDFLVEKGAAEPCDSLAIAEMWNRTALVYGMIYTHLEVENTEEYHTTIEYIIDMIINGVDVIPKGKISASWEGMEAWEEIDINQFSTKDKIMYNALDLFSELGYEKVTLKIIAEESNVSTSSIYRYYRSKSEIMSDITKKLTDKYNCFSIHDPSFTAVINDYNHGELALYLSGSYPPIKEEKSMKLYKVLFREQYFNEEIKDLFLSSIFRDQETVTRNLQELLEAGRIPFTDFDALGRIFVYTMRSLTIGQALGELSFQKTQDLREKITFLIASMAINGYLNR